MHFCPSHETFPICLSSSPHQKTGAAVSSSRLFFHVMHSRRQPARSPTPLRTSRIIQGAELLPYQTSEPRGLSPSGGNSAAQLHIPLRPCAAKPRSPGCRASALPALLSRDGLADLGENIQVVVPVVPGIDHLYAIELVVRAGVKDSARQLHPVGQSARVVGINTLGIQ